jgi:hypothetical protein
MQWPEAASFNRTCEGKLPMTDGIFINQNLPLVAASLRYIKGIIS